MGCSQQGIIGLVLWRISKIPDETVRKNMYEALVKNLKREGDIERGSVMCCTRKLGRLIMCLDGLDLERTKNCVPMGIAREEIASLASNTEMM